MNNSYYFTLAALLATFHCINAFADGPSFKSLKSCQKNYSDVLEFKEEQVAEIKDFPPGLYLARSVIQSFEKSSEKFFFYQSLLEDTVGEESDLCFKGSPKSAIKAKSYIPTLIDMTRSHNWGNTFWSVSADIKQATGSISSRRSLVPNRDYRERLRKQGYKIFSAQKNHDVFQIRLIREVRSWKETILITYDQF